MTQRRNGGVQSGDSIFVLALTPPASLSSSASERVNAARNARQHRRDGRTRVSKSNWSMAWDPPSRLRCWRRPMSPPRPTPRSCWPNGTILGSKSPAAGHRFVGHECVATPRRLNARAELNPPQAAAQLQRWTTDLRFRGGSRPIHSGIACRVLESVRAIQPSGIRRLCILEHNSPLRWTVPPSSCGAKCLPV